MSKHPDGRELDEMELRGIERDDFLAPPDPAAVWPELCEWREGVCELWMGGVAMVWCSDVLGLVWVEREKRKGSVVWRGSRWVIWIEGMVWCEWVEWREWCAGKSYGVVNEKLGGVVSEGNNDGMRNEGCGVLCE